MSIASGVSHIMLTVTDLDAWRHFWVDVIGLEVAVDQGAVLICVDARARLGIGCIQHASGDPAPFDERRVGLDHLAFSVADLPALQDCELRLGRFGVPFTPIVESAWGWHLNARGPENVAVELHVTRERVLDALYGEPGSARARLERVLAEPA